MSLAKRFFAASLLVVFAFAVLALTAFAEGNGEKHFYDNAGIIDNDAAVVGAISDFEDRTGVPLYIVTTVRPYPTPSNVIDGGISTQGNVIILIIECGTSENYYELFTYGDPYTDISQTEADRILDNSTVYNEIKWGDVDTGVLKFIELTEQAYTGVLQESILKTVVISAILAVAIAVIPVIVTVSRYKRKLKGASYPLERYARLSLYQDQCSDVFIGSFVTRTRINTSSGSGLRGGRGGGGGGSRGRR